MKKQLILTALAAVSVLTVQAKHTSGVHQEPVSKMGVGETKQVFAGIRKAYPSAFSAIETAAKAIKASGDVRTPLAATTLSQAVTNVTTQKDISDHIEAETGVNGGTFAQHVQNLIQVHPAEMLDAVAEPQN